LMRHLPPSSTRFPYTTLFRSKDYLTSGLTKVEIWKKYTGAKDHGNLVRWMRDLGYTLPNRDKSSNIVSNLYPMPKNQSKRDNLTDRKSTRLNSSHVKISYAVF